MKMTIIKKSDDWFVLQFTTDEGYQHFIDPFRTYNEAYEHYRRYYANKDDLK